MYRLLSRINNMLYANSHIVHDDDSLSGILIVPYAFYTHKHKTLKDASSKDLSDIIAFETSQCEETHLLVTKKIKQAETVTLHLYFIDLVWANKYLKKALFAIPECWIIGQALDVNSVVSVGDIFIARTGSGIYSIKRSLVMRLPELFAEANGISPERVVGVDCRQDEWVRKGFESLELQSLISFLNPLLHRRIKHYDFRPSLVACGIVLSVYLGFSSLYYSWKLESVDAELQALHPQMTSALSAANSAETGISSLQQYQTLFNTRAFTLPIWLALEPAYESDGKLIFIRYLADGSFSVAIESSSASKLIKSISENEWVESAVLDGEVQSLDDKERYQVRISLRKDDNNDA